MTPYDSVYAPQRIGEEGGGEDVTLPSDGEGGGDYGDVDGGEHPTGEALVPYNEVYASYYDVAAGALEGSYIPLGMKQYVREYFSALEP